MHVKCAECGAAYDFPVDQLPDDGLRAKCAACGHVMVIRRGEGRSAPPESVAPPVVAPRAAPVPPLTTPPPDLRAPTPPPEATKKKRPRPAPKPVRRPDPTPEPASTGPSAPKVIVDIGQLGDAAAAEEARRVADEAREQAAAQAMFSPLGTPAPMVVAERARVRADATGFRPEEDGDLRLRSGGLARALLVGGALLLVAAVAFVFWRNDFGPIWTDPASAVAIALGRPVAVPAPPATPRVVEAATVEGNLEVRDVEMRLLEPDRRSRAAVIRGTLLNHTNRTQRGVTLEASILRLGDALPLHTRKVACCDVLDDEAALAVLADPSHPHLTDLARAAAVRLGPGERRAFAVVLPALDPRAPADSLESTVRVHFAEAESPHP